MSFFTLNYNVTGAERKRLAGAISSYTMTPAKYLGAPSFAYEVDYFHIDKNGCVSFDDRADSEEIEGLIDALDSQGFTAEAADTEHGLTVSLPLDGFNPDSLERLQKLIDSKASLIQKALGADRLTVQVSDSTVRFPWWDTLPEPEETQAATAFIAALCKMAREAQRVTATEKEVESEKYAFRGFLLRLGFIGAESKAYRRVLLRRLSGSAAFPNSEKAEAFSAAQKAKRTAAKMEMPA